MVRVVCEIYLGQVVDSAILPFPLLLSQSVEEGRISWSHVLQGCPPKKMTPSSQHLVSFTNRGVRITYLS